MTIEIFHFKRKLHEIKFISKLRDTHQEILPLINFVKYDLNLYLSK